MGLRDCQGMIPTLFLLRVQLHEASFIFPGALGH